MTLVQAHLVATLMMTGVIWFVQLVHYPLFPYARQGDFLGFSADHQQRTTWVVAPLMLVEVATAGLLLLADPGNGLLWFGALLLAVIWLSTGFVQVPLHGRLAQGFDASVASKLVATNWLRTVCWTARAAVSLALL